jgi:hypothetical protein
MTQLSNVVLLVPEITKGMKSVGSKALLHINKSLTVIDYQILYIKKYYKNTPIKIITGFDNDRLVKHTKKYSNIDICHTPNYNDYNQTEFVVRYIKKCKPNNFLLINNGVLLKEKLNIETDKSSVFILPKKRDGFSIGSQFCSDIKYLFYDLEYQWSECVFFSTSTIVAIDEISKTKKLHNLFLFELINILIEKRANIGASVLANPKNIFKVNIIGDMKKTKTFYDKNIFTRN